MLLKLKLPKSNKKKEIETPWKGFHTFFIFKPQALVFLNRIFFNMNRLTQSSILIEVFFFLFYSSPFAAVLAASLLGYVSISFSHLEVQISVLFYFCVQNISSFIWLIGENPWTAPLKLFHNNNKKLIDSWKFLATIFLKQMCFDRAVVVNMVIKVFFSIVF